MEPILPSCPPYLELSINVLCALKGALFIFALKSNFNIGLKKSIQQKMKNCHVAGSIERFSIEYERNEYKQGTIVLLLGKPNAVFLCMDSIRSNLVGELPLRIKSIRSLEAVLIDYARIKKYNCPDDSYKQASDLAVNVDFKYEEEEEPQLTPKLCII